MRAVTVVPGDRLEVVERDDPIPTAGVVVVRVAGAGINRADLLQKAGLYRAPDGSPADIPGLEFSGTVESAGTGTSLAIGDRVFGICGGGGQAERLAVPEGQCAPVPKGVDLVIAGGVPEVYVTAHDAMVTQAEVSPGEWVLVHAAGSGVGTAAIQLAKALGARVIGTARTADKLDRARDLGLDVGVVPPLAEGGQIDAAVLASEIVAATDGGVDVTLDLVGGSYVEADIAASRLGGRIVMIGALAGARAELSVLTVMQRRLRLHGTVLRTRSVEEKSAAVAAFARDVVPLLADGSITPITEEVFDLGEVSAAYDLVASNTTFGKVILDAAAT